MSDPIKHVVVVMLENRSFDQMIGYLKADNIDVDGVNAGNPFCNPDLPSTNPPIGQAPCTTRTIVNDPAHDLDNVLQQIAGPCEGFVTDFVRNFPQSDARVRAEIMGFYPRGFLPALHGLADNFTVCDRWFSSMPGPTWPNRFFVHSGTCLGHVKMPNGFWHPNLYPYDQTTVYDRLEEQGLTWKIYYGDVPQTLVMTHQWKYPEHYHRLPDMFTDVHGLDDDFPAYSFIEPCYFGSAENDQHPPTDVLKGDALLAQIYNAIRAKDSLWNSTLIVVLYDEHGGFADHVAPPPTIPPDDHVEEYAFNQYGVRVPAVLVSPWVKRGVVHTTLDHTSLLKYLIDKWRLGDLGKRCASAQTFTSEVQDIARTDTPQSVPVAHLDPALIAALPPSANILNANQAALLGFTQYLETRLAEVEPKASVARRSLMAAGSPESQAAVAGERIEKFLDYRRRHLL